MLLSELFGYRATVLRNWAITEPPDVVSTRILLGLCDMKLSRRDEFITEELTNHLFQVIDTPRSPVTLGFQTTKLGFVSHVYYRVPLKTMNCVVKRSFLNFFLKNTCFCFLCNVVKTYFLDDPNLHYFLFFRHSKSSRMIILLFFRPQNPGSGWTWSR